MESGNKRSSSDKDPNETELPPKRVRRAHEGVNTKEEVRAGVIESIAVKNFMCHVSLEVSLNKRINFVVGRNGSGKSAILAAVVVALGSRAATTNRANALKDFVKKGSNTALVQVTLHNDGLMAYKPGIYGRRITISRTIHASTTASTFKIKSERGEVISTKRDELHRILTHLNIQIDNPVCILNQDTSRTFLKSADPKTKYTVFMKATRIEDIVNLHNDSETNEETARMKLDLCYTNLRQTDIELKELQRTWQHFEKLKNCQARIVSIENELAWAVARDEEKVLANMKKDFSAEEGAIQHRKECVEKIIGHLKEADEQLSSLNIDAHKRSKDMHEIRAQRDEAAEKARARKREYVISLQTYKAVSKKVFNHGADIKSVVAAIDNLRSESNPENVVRKKQIQDRLEACLREQEKLLAIQRTTQQDMSKLQGEGEHYKDSLTQLKAFQGQVISTIDKRKREMNTLKNQKSNLSLYAPWMEELCRRIEDVHRRRKFTRKPLGPIGLFLKLRDKNWIRGVESELGFPFLQSFVCDCSNDARILNQIMLEIIQGGPKPGIFVGKFKDKVHNIGDKLARCPGYMSMYEMLDISDPNIANCLIDNKGVESVLLIPTDSEATRIMSDKNRPHKNCKRCITITGDVYYPYPDYKTYANNKRMRYSVLQTSTQEAIRNLEVEIVSAQQELGSFEVRMNELRDKINVNEKEGKKVKQKLSDINQQIARLTYEMKDLEEALDTGSINIKQLEAELEELRTRLAKLEEDEKLLDEETVNKKAVAEAAAQEVRALDESLKTNEEERNRILTMRLMVKDKMKQLDNDRKEAERICEALEEKVRDAELKYTAQKEKTERAVQHAEGIHAERIQTERAVSDIEKEVNECKGYLGSAQTRAGHVEDVSQKLAEKRNMYTQRISLFHSMKKGLKVMKAALKSRESLIWLVHRVMSLRVTYMFEPLLSERGYMGSIKFDHGGKTLDVQASPANEKVARETKSLSGGERSFSTVAFLLALWECVEPPFYFLDEFDVFMDKLNRQVAMDLLLGQARAKQKQYVFLTPQETPVISLGEDITIHQMDDPERSHRTRE